MAATPTLGDVKAWLGLEPGDTTDDLVLQESLDAALEYVHELVVYPKDVFGDPTYTAPIREAVFLLTQRLAARRNSPEGVIGLTGVGGDFVSARVPAYDNDVLQMLGPYLTIPVA
jgi:hypothetical protein